MNKILFCRVLALCIFASSSIMAQNNDPENERIKVFIDCSNTWCDAAFIKTEINIVDFLLDRIASDVHVLITSSSTGGGGNHYQMIFYGQNRFRMFCDTISYNVNANATALESRELLLKHLKLGLVPFITKTGLISGVIIGMKQEAAPGKQMLNSAGKKDPWNYWVMTIQTDGNINAEKLYKNFGYSGNFSASRITEDLKLGFSLYGSNSKATYIIENDTSVEKFIAKNSYYGMHHYFVKSISNHWSTGYESIFTNSTFSNYKAQFYIRAAVEYNIFPYTEFNNRSLTFSYGIITRFNNYYDTTIYNKLKETLFAHSFRGTLTLNKKWGTVNSGIFYSNFFHDWKLNNMGVSLNVNVRITGRLSFYIYSSGSLVHDQLYLPKSGATEQEVLTRLRQLKSSYNLQNRVGISYRFGSKLNNFVNPRFDGD